MGIRRNFRDNEHITFSELTKYIELFDYPNVRLIRIYFKENSKTVKVCADNYKYMQIGEITYNDCELSDAYDIEYLYKNAFDYPHPAEIVFDIELEKRPSHKKYKVYKRS